MPELGISNLILFVTYYIIGLKKIFIIVSTTLLNLNKDKTIVAYTCTSMYIFAYV